MVEVLASDAVWGPNTVHNTQAFVIAASSAWDGDPQDRYVWTAFTQGGGIVGLGELGSLTPSTSGIGEMALAPQSVCSFFHRYLTDSDSIELQRLAIRAATQTQLSWAESE